jgi:ammonia channel protein AmtB
LSAYVIVSFLLASFVYPIILAWTWGKGWLYDAGFHDFAGSGIIHLVAGTTAFWGAWSVGERRAKIRVRENREINKQEVNVKSSAVQNELNELNSDFSTIAKKHFAVSSGELKRNNTTFIVIGGLLIWASYLFFVGGRTLTQFNPRSSNPAKII